VDSGEGGGRVKYQGRIEQHRVRNSEIRERRRQQWSYEDIARAFDLTKQRVWQICTNQRGSRYSSPVGTPEDFYRYERFG
jgi:hypothetical protein